MAYIEINKKNFFNNLDYFSTLVGDKSKLSIALKDNAYGHGIEEIAYLCSQYGIKHVFVKNLYEANLAKKYKFESIQILYEVSTELVDFNITINSLSDLNKVAETSSIELKIDTGMHRNGVLPFELQRALELIEQKDLNLVGVFSHFCCADEDNEIVQSQEVIFWETIKKIKELYTKSFNIHIANTVGVHRIDNSKYDKARIGIGAYGYIDLKAYQNYLKPVLSLYGEKISTRNLNIGEHIGYGSKAYVVRSNNFIVSNYDIGYGDGLFRLNEIKKSKILNGKEVLGRVSMDSFSLEGDDDIVCIFNDVSFLSEVHNTIVYEILVHLNPFIKRVIR